MARTKVVVDRGLYGNGETKLLEGNIRDVGAVPRWEHRGGRAGPQASKQSPHHAIFLLQLLLLDFESIFFFYVSTQMFGLVEVSTQGEVPAEGDHCFCTEEEHQPIALYPPRLY